MKKTRKKHSLFEFLVTSYMRINFSSLVMNSCAFSVTFKLPHLCNLVMIASQIKFNYHI